MSDENTSSKATSPGGPGSQQRQDERHIAAWCAANLPAELITTRQQRVEADALEAVRHALDVPSA